MDNYYVHDLHHTLPPQQRVYLASEADAEIAELKANSASNDIQIKAHWSLLKDKEDEIAELKANLHETIELLHGSQADAIREMFKHCGAWAVLKDGTKELIDLDVDACVAHADKLERG